MEQMRFMQRASGVRDNPYQRRMVVLALGPTFILCAAITAFVILFQDQLVKMLVYSASTASVYQARAVWCSVLLGVWVFFTATAVWVTASSQNLVGAFGRIIKVLDDMIYGKERKLIHARERDWLANALLERVNILIKHLPSSGGSVPVKTIGRF